MVMESLPESTLSGRTVLVAADCFASNHFLLAGLARRLGFALRTVPLRQGAAWVEDEDFLARWTPDVGLALITWVSSTPSCMAALASLPAMDWHAAQDQAALLEQNRSLTDRIFTLADDIGLRPLTPRAADQRAADQRAADQRAADQRGGSVMLELPSDLPGAAVVTRLRQNGVTADHRGQTLRLSPGVITTDDDCDRLRLALGRVLDARGTGSGSWNWSDDRDLGDEERRE